MMPHVTFRGYLIGFGGSLATTLIAYALVVSRVLSADAAVGAVLSLAFVQFVLQMIFFLHLGTETKPRWKQLVFWFMLLVVGILVVGSIWIMKNLDYHGMSPHETDTYIMIDEGIKK